MKTLEQYDQFVQDQQQWQCKQVNSSTQTLDKLQTPFQIYVIDFRSNIDREWF